MPLPLQQFVKELTDSGILDGDTLKDFLPPQARPKDADDLVRELVRRKKLTRYQAEQVHRGHGRSDGQGQMVDSFDDYVADLATFVTDVRTREPNEPLFLFGHSMGGAIATLYAETRDPQLAGLVLSAPALRHHVGDFDHAFLDLFSAVAPYAGVLSLEEPAFTRDPAALAEMQHDPLIHHESGPARTAAELPAPPLYDAHVCWLHVADVTYVDDETVTSSQGDSPNTPNVVNRASTAASVAASSARICAPGVATIMTPLTTCGGAWWPSATPVWLYSWVPCPARPVWSDPTCSQPTVGSSSRRARPSTPVRPPTSACSSSATRPTPTR